MLRKMLDSVLNYRFYVTNIFCNTGKEDDKTLDFLHKIEMEWDVKIIWLEYTRVPANQINADVYPNPISRNIVLEQQRLELHTHWFKEVNYETARRNGQPNGPFDEMLGWAGTLPNVMARGCTGQLKVRTIRRYLYNAGCYRWSEMIGIRADEAHRCVQIKADCPSYLTPRFPLVEMNMRVEDVRAFWKQNDFDLGLEDYEGNCDLCFLKAKWKRIKLIKEKPERATWWKNWEAIFKAKPGDGDGNVFRKGQPYEDLERAAMNAQADLFPESESDIPCSCAERGFSDEPTP